jgi:AAA domain/Domain of unknown function (DUF6371)/Toprim-like
MSGAIPFDQIRAVSLAQADRLLRDWFPNGRLVGREFKVGNIAGDRGESLSINVDTGKWADFAAGIGGNDLIGVRAAMKHSADRSAAARELGPMLGVTMNGRDTSAKTAARPQQKRDKSTDVWEPIVPPPANAPKPAKSEFVDWDKFYDYLDADGRLLFYIRRREARNGKRKQFNPLVYGTLNGQRGWHDKHADAPRPIYGLDRLAATPGATVIVCEGEKSAIAAQHLFPDYVCVTWPNGSKSVEHADLTPLRDRRVIIWPDNDEDGHRAANDLKRALPHASVVQVLDLPESHDAADVTPDDPDVWLAGRLIAEASESKPKSDASLLVGLLSIQAWTERQIPNPDQLLGEVLTVGGWMFLIGRTGLGKTMLAFAIACGIATGDGFLHWRCTKPKRVLLLDGEMPEGLIKARAIDALRRIKGKPKPENLVIYSRYLEDEFAKLCPTIGKMPPLNTEEGHGWVLALIDAIGGVDVVIFDNVMSLIVGDQKDELSWSGAMPLVQALTSLNVAQLWLDHTGWNTDRQYGTSTKAWPFDSAGVMMTLADDQRDPREVAFTLSFDFPGKCRRRTPDNWSDFETCIIRLKEHRWTSEPANKAPGGGKLSKVPPSREPFYDALIAAIGRNPIGRGRTGLATWEAECQRRSLIERALDQEDYKQRGVRLRLYRTAKSDLLAARWIAVEDDLVTDLKGRWT